MSEQVTKEQKGPAPIYVDLTPIQTLQIAAHFDHVSAEFAKGEPGMLVAQVMRYEDGTARMRVGYIANEKAKYLQKVQS